ncbi:N-acetylglucosamine-6-phosphate deacetylase [Falsibacillus albus]|uniref:N-acetylglucosamine-6-phosphate deacetylase n=1 Tax=Falsibacillus albus TaxID=2478915 RepID=A0A3L7K2J4_9BACI|nr:N-acetylglucosamine-6-phosphate deacetylase [Falsibacillus albus]RLQ96594.1 N-acetylglucosamine-6-phosphate deacetylase [Falsibacillus albus]
MNTSTKTILKGCTIFLENETLQNGYVMIQGEKIVEAGDIASCPTHSGNTIITLPSSFKITPGFIDVHIHGAGGADTMDGTADALQTISSSLPQEGTTSYLATTITQSHENIKQALLNVAGYTETQSSGQAEILGIHLEGPFINSCRAGAQPKEYIQQPDIELFEEWNNHANRLIKLVTLAPELKGGLEFVDHLASKGIIASVGHSDATFEEVKLAADAGATHVTHLFNGMKGLHHRELGVAGAALKLNELMVELIADGIHLHPEMMELVYRMKTAEKMLLITDSMRAKCLKNGRYDLGGQEVTVQHGKALLEDGTLAGSILKMKDAIRNMSAYLDISLREILQMATVNPAKQLHVFDRKGSLTPGKDADIVVLNEGLDVMLTICKGKLAYRRGDW